MALSPHTKIAFGWAIAVTTGLYSFYLSKQYVDGHRYEAMKARERIASAADDTSKTLRPIPAQYKD